MLTSTCWHTSSDGQRPFVSKLSVFRVHQGNDAQDMPLFVGDAKRPFGWATTTACQAKDYVREPMRSCRATSAPSLKVDEIEFAFARFFSDGTPSTRSRSNFRCDGASPSRRKEGRRATPVDVLHKLELEDPCFKVERHPTTNRTVIRGLGEMHLRAKLFAHGDAFKIELDTKAAADSPTARRSAAKTEDTAGTEAELAGLASSVKSCCASSRSNAAPASVRPISSSGTIPASSWRRSKGCRQALADGVVGGFPVGSCVCDRALTANRTRSTTGCIA